MPETTSCGHFFALARLEGHYAAWLTSTSACPAVPTAVSAAETESGESAESAESGESAESAAREENVVCEDIAATMARQG